MKSCKGWLGPPCPAYGCVCSIYFCERKLTYLFVTFEKMGVMLGMSGLKRTPGIKCIHMCPGGGEKAEGMSRLSLPRLFVTLFVCPVERC